MTIIGNSFHRKKVSFTEIKDCFQADIVTYRRKSTFKSCTQVHLLDHGIWYLTIYTFKGCTQGMHISHGMYTWNAHQPWYVHRECTLAMVCTQGMHISHGMYTENAHQPWLCNIKPIFYDKLQLYKVLWKNTFTFCSSMEVHKQTYYVLTRP